MHVDLTGRKSRVELEFRDRNREYGWVPYRKSSRLAKMVMSVEVSHHAIETGSYPGLRTVTFWWYLWRLKR